jgi:hypothetical protein
MKSLKRNEVNEMANTIKVARNGEKHVELLRLAFNAVCNPNDWKAPVDAIVPFEAASMYYDAIVFVTGTTPKSERTVDGNMRLMAIGYRAGPCGDH